MQIQETTTVTVAEVTITDEYRVQVQQMRRSVDYAPDQAEQLGQALIAAAIGARQMLDEHLSDLATRSIAAADVDAREVY